MVQMSCFCGSNYQWVGPLSKHNIKKSDPKTLIQQLHRNRRRLVQCWQLAHRLKCVDVDL